MRVLIAPDSYGGTLSAAQAGEAIAAGWHRHAPDDELDLCPMSDGGPGFLDVMHAALAGRLLPVTVPGPLGEPTPAAVLVVDGVGYLETAQACGLHLVPAGRRDPGRTTTAGVGRLLAAAREAGASRVVAGLGGSGTNDAGAGMLAGLGAGALDPALAARLAGGGSGLAGLTRADLSGLPDLVAVWAGVGIVAATDVDSPLLGSSGASKVYALQKGASPQQAAELDAALADFARAAVLALELPPSTAVRPGAGAAGGLGFGLFLLGGERASGVRAVAGALRLADRIAAADLVVTGEGTLDWQSLRGKVVAGLAELALERGVPVVAIGVEAAYPVARNPDEVAASMADPAARLADRTERVARTWSRPLT